MRRPSRICIALAACLCGPAAAGEVKLPSDTPAQRAGRLYASAMSAFRTRQWEQAQGLLERFVAGYGSHEYVPVSWLQLAYCRRQLKDQAGHDAALEQVVRKFSGSPAYFVAYGAKLAGARSAKDNDGFLALLEAMLAEGHEAPWALHGAIARSYGQYYHGEYHGRHFQATGARGGAVVGRFGWVLDVLEMADTPDRARRALGILGKNFSLRSGDLPPDWQHAHVVLLRRAGKAEEADKALADYLRRWGDDPRGVALWTLEIQAARARKDAQAVDKAFDELLKTHAGADILEEPLYAYLAGLCRQDRHDRFVELAGRYLRTYTTSRRRHSVVSLWLAAALRRSGKGDTSRIDPAMRMLEEVYDGSDPVRQRTKLLWKIRAYLQMDRAAEAAKVAAELITEPQWSAASFDLITGYAASHKAMAPVVDAARRRWRIPLPDPTSNSFRRLSELRSRLKDNQVRHAEEIGEEMYAKHRDDASTIEGVKLLADYYFRKVLGEERDKWMDRMVLSYPHHPLTEGVLAHQVTSENAARRYGRLALALDTMLKRFPSAARRWYTLRLTCYNQADDPVGALGYVKRIHGPRAEGGDIESLEEIAKYELSATGTDYKVIGDYWAEKAGKFAGTRTALHCLWRAWSAYYLSPHLQGRTSEIQWEPALAALQAMRTQTLNPQLRWRLTFADVNMLASKAEGKAALEALNERLEADRSYRDLSVRLDFVLLGSALGRAGLVREGPDLAKRLRNLCPNDRDGGAIELMQAAMYLERKDYAAAARHYLKVVKSGRFPARMCPYFLVALNCLRQANSKRFIPELEAYVRRISRVQELVPGLLFQAGEYHLQRRDRAAVSIRQRLLNRYPASAARDRLEKLFDKRRK